LNRTYKNANFQSSQERVEEPEAAAIECKLWEHKYRYLRNFTKWKPGEHPRELQRRQAWNV
jgi:hypothetical protein